MALVWVNAMAASAGYAQDRAATEASLLTGQGSDIARRRCLTCHGIELIAQQRLTRDEWNRELDKMMAWGAEVPPPDRPPLLDFLANQFGKTPQPRLPDMAAADLLRTRCQACHDRTLVDQQRLTLDGWRREIDKMIAWGARVTENEKAALAAHLASR